MRKRNRGAQRRAGCRRCPRAGWRERLSWLSVWMGFMLMLVPALSQLDALCDLVRSCIMGCSSHRRHRAVWDAAHPSLINPWRLICALW